MPLNTAAPANKENILTALFQIEKAGGVESDAFFPPRLFCYSYAFFGAY